MIYELKNRDFKKIEHLLSGDFINLGIKAVIQEFNPGWVFVDNPEKPQTAVIWSKGICGFYFVGDDKNANFNNSINYYIDKEISPRAKDLGLNSFEFSGTTLEWENTLEGIFHNRDIYKSKQFVYKYKNLKERTLGEIPLHSDYSVKTVNHELLNSNFANLDFIRSVILEWWDSEEDFLEKGIGFCILHGQEIVSSCISSFVTENSMEPFIVTLENYRKKGLAKKAASEFLKYCKNNGYEHDWDCMEENFGSRALAESLGYDKVFEYSLYRFELNKKNS